MDSPRRRRRHPKKDVEAALRAAELAGWTVEEIHRSHRWGRIICPTGIDVVPIWSTPADPTTFARNTRKEIARCPHRTQKRAER